jgi:hypothetical protein
MFEKPPTTESVPSPENEPKPLRSALEVANLKYPEEATSIESVTESETTPENIPTETEKAENTEYIPSETEVESQFEKLLGGKELITKRKLADDKGVYLWDIRTTDSDGIDTEYTYTRKGPHAGGNPAQTVIHVAYYDRDGDCIGGNRAAVCIAGNWHIVDDLN